MGARVIVKPKSAARLNMITSPGPGAMEAIPHVAYDTQSYTLTGLASLTFFQTQQSDRTLSNMEGAGQFPEPQAFEIHYVLLDFLAAGPSNVTIPASGTNQTGILNDIDLLIKTQRATLTLAISNKNYGPWPASFMHASGGSVGNIASGSTTLAQQVANNGVQDGGWFVGGALIIPPKVGFSWVLGLAAAQAISVTTNLRLSMAGVLHRRVL